MVGSHRIGSIAKAVGRLVMRLVLLAFCACIVAALVVTIVLPRATHGSALTVLTGSMTPQIPVGSVVIIRPVDPGTLQAGDVATYQVEEGEESFITHRITKVHAGPNGLQFTFKGDANRGPDLDPIPAGAVRGEVWFHVPYIGAVRDALHGKGGVTLLAMLALAGYAISQVSAGLRDRKKGSATAAASDDSAQLHIDRTLVLAEFPHSASEDTAVDLARRWGAIVVRSDDVGFALLIAPPPDGLAAVLELLEAQHPSGARVWEAPSVLVGAPRAIATDAKGLARAT